MFIYVAHIQTELLSNVIPGFSYGGLEMRVAVASSKEKGGKVFAHFGRADFFQIFETEKGKNSYVESRKNKRDEKGGHFHDSIISMLGDVATVIAAGMGSGAQAHLISEGKEIIVTTEMDIEEAVEKYSRGELAHDPGRVHSHKGHDHGDHTHEHPHHEHGHNILNIK